jgi:NodT family efflux transporter outer membrane factor (OMF) lipoprotein
MMPVPLWPALLVTRTPATSVSCAAAPSMSSSQNPLLQVIPLLSRKTILLFVAFIFSFILLASGCAKLPHASSPASTLLAANTLNAGSALRSGSAMPAEWPKERWWQGYGDPQLDSLVLQATAGNPTMGIARARVAKVKALAGVARATLFPHLDGEASFTRQRFSEHQFIPHPYAGNWAWTNQATLDLSYDFDLWGKNRSNLAAALDYVQMASADAQEVKLELVTAVVRVYVDLSLQYALLDIARAALKQRQEIFDITKRRVKAGLGTELDLREAETPLPAERAEIERIRESIELLHNELAALTGKGPGDGEKISRPRLALDLPVRLPAILPADLLGRRPDIVASRWRVEAASKGIDAAKAAFYPNINISAFAGVQSLNFAQFLSPGSLIAGFGPAISLPIFRGGELRSELEASTADYDIAVEFYNSTLITALEKVANEVVSLRSLETQRAEADTSNALAGRAYSIAVRSYRAGLTDYLKVLNAENQTLEEGRRKAQVQARYLDAYAALMEAVGGGVALNPPQPKGRQ